MGEIEDDADSRSSTRAPSRGSRKRMHPGHRARLRADHASSERRRSMGRPRGPSRAPTACFAVASRRPSTTPQFGAASPRRRRALEIRSATGDHSHSSPGVPPASRTAQSSALHNHMISNSASSTIGPSKTIILSGPSTDSAMTSSPRRSVSAWLHSTAQFASDCATADVAGIVRASRPSVLVGGRRAASSGMQLPSRKCR